MITIKDFLLDLGFILLLHLPALIVFSMILKIQLDKMWRPLDLKFEDIEKSMNEVQHLAIVRLEDRIIEDVIQIIEAQPACRYIRDDEGLAYGDKGHDYVRLDLTIEAIRKGNCSDWIDK